MRSVTDDTPSDLDPRTPVLVGVGTCHDDAEAAELMARAVLAAGEDAGTDLLEAVDRLAVTKGTWSYTDPARIVADRIGATSAVTALYELGIPQQTTIDETLGALIAGDADVALVCGGEAKARDARLRSRSTQADADGLATMVRGEGDAWEIDQGGVEPDVHRQPDGALVDPVEIEAGLWAPVDQYAMIENALGAAEDRTPDQLRDDIAALHARFNLVARSNPEAAFPAPMDERHIRTFGSENRPLSFPYGKWHVTQWTVDQAAALLLTTVEVAERAGVPRSRWVFPLVALSSSHGQPLTQRRAPHRWPAMAVLGEAAADRLGHPLADCDHADLYSCFPVAVRVQQRELGLPLDASPTVTGGMAFAGGPFNNYVFQSTVAMVRRLREDGGRGLVTAVSGLLTKPGLAVWATEPDGAPPLIADLAGRAEAASPSVPVRSGISGEVTVVTWTVTHEGQEAKELVALVEDDDGTRGIARLDDPALVARAMSDGLVGAPVVV
ncbi:MAG: hypothetical protein U5K30_07355 [Acidimicrobiales bacterium]|nr:hypothetical protein [Acidimicrobiales bacterium]